MDKATLVFPTQSLAKDCDKKQATNQSLFLSFEGSSGVAPGVQRLQPKRTRSGQ